MGIASSMRELTQDITWSHENRVKTLLEIKEEARHVTGDARNLIKDFQTSRAAAGVQLRKDLSRDKASRKSDVKKMLGDARRDINAFQSQRKEAGTKLRKELAQSQASRKSEVAELLKSAQDIITDIGKSRQETGKKLRNDLAKGRADRESEVKEMRSEFAKSRAEVRGDIDAARAAWQELTRGAKKVAAAPEPAKVKIKEAPVAKEAPPAEQETPNLESELLAVVERHPEGATLVEIAEHLGVVPVVLGRAAKKLLDDGKLRKEDKTYFPVVSE